MNKNGEIYSGLAVIAIPLFILMLLLNFIPKQTGLSLVRENGVIETFSVVGYFIGLVVAIFIAKRLKWPAGYSVGIIMMLLGFRELDFDTRFTSRGILSIKFYWSPDVGVVERTVAVLLVLLIGAFLFMFLKKYAGIFFNGLRKKTPHIYTAAAGIVSLPLSYNIDGGYRWLDNMGQGFRTLYIEESLELAIPFFFIAAMIQFYRSVGNRGFEKRV